MPGSALASAASGKSGLSGPVLDRSDAQRAQEFKYRFGQSVVFGTPVIVLQWIGRSLGGAEADRWVALFQALLAGWVVYVAATGMIAEGAMLLLARRRLPAPLAADVCAAMVALSLYLAGLPRLLGLLLGHRAAGAWPAPFAAVVLLLAGWCAVRWLQKRCPAGSPRRV